MDVQNNLKAIYERGWNPLTRALLLDNVIRATVTEDMLKWEQERGLFSESQLKKYHSNLHYSTDENGGITIQAISNTKTECDNDLNFKQFFSRLFEFCEIE